MRRHARSRCRRSQATRPSTRSSGDGSMPSSREPKCEPPPASGTATPARARTATPARAHDHPCTCARPPLHVQGLSLIHI
eukprot:6198542-Prymnesium_polylepis.1